MWINVWVKSIYSGFLSANEREITKSPHLVWTHPNLLSQQKKVSTCKSVAFLFSFCGNGCTSTWCSVVLVGFFCLSSVYCTKLGGSQFTTPKGVFGSIAANAVHFSPLSQSGQLACFLWIYTVGYVFFRGFRVGGSLAWEPVLAFILGLLSTIHCAALALSEGGSDLDR